MSAQVRASEAKYVHQHSFYLHYPEPRLLELAIRDTMVTACSEACS